MLKKIENEHCFRVQHAISVWINPDTCSKVAIEKLEQSVKYVKS